MGAGILWSQFHHRGMSVRFERQYVEDLADTDDPARVPQGEACAGHDEHVCQVRPEIQVDGYSRGPG
jgi:hypothetical protein